MTPLQKVAVAIQQTDDRQRLRRLNRLWWRLFFLTLQPPAATVGDELLRTVRHGL